MEYYFSKLFKSLSIVIILILFVPGQEANYPMSGGNILLDVLFIIYT